MKYFRIIRTIVLSTDMPLWKYCAITSLLLFSTTTAINFSVRRVMELIGIKEKEPIILSTISSGISTIDLLIITAIGPLIETILLSAIAFILSYVIKNKYFICIVCALMIAFTHKVEIWFGYIVFINMFFQSTIFYLVRSKISYLNGFIAAIIPHSVNNLIIVSTLLYIK